MTSGTERTDNPWEEWAESSQELFDNLPIPAILRNPFMYYHAADTSCEVLRFPCDKIIEFLQDVESIDVVFVNANDNSATFITTAHYRPKTDPDSTVPIEKHISVSKGGALYLGDTIDFGLNTEKPVPLFFVHDTGMNFSTVGPVREDNEAA